MKKIRYISFALAFLAIAALFAGCAEKEEDKPLMSLNTVLNIADTARDIELKFFSQFEYVILGSTEVPLYYFQLKETDFSFSVGVGEDGMIKSMMLSHISGDEIYLFHKDPAKLDSSAAQYTEDAKSYDLQKFIDKVTEN